MTIYTVCDYERVPYAAFTTRKAAEEYLAAQRLCTYHKVCDIQELRLDEPETRPLVKSYSAIVNFGTRMISEGEVVVSYDPNFKTAHLPTRLGCGDYWSTAGFWQPTQELAYLEADKALGMWDEFRGNREVLRLGYSTIRLVEPCTTA